MMFPPPGPSMTYREKAVITCKPSVSHARVENICEPACLTAIQDDKSPTASIKHVRHNQEIVAVKVRQDVTGLRNAQMTLRDQ